jgi:hypothetical protein
VNDVHTKPSGWKQKLVHEMVEYYLNFVYLAFFLVAFTWYRRLTLAEYNIHFLEYWVPLIEAAVLAKVIMIGDLLGVGRRLKHKPLIVPTFYRTVTFSVWVAVFSVLEKTIGGLLHGHGLTGGVAELASKGRYELLAQCVVMFAAFIPFFAFKELEGVLGQDKLRSLFWNRATPASDASSHGTAGEKRS